MAYQLFIQKKDLKKFSILDGNIDSDRLMHCCKIAHDIHLQNYLGTDLFERLQAGITAEDLNADETGLLDNYVKDMAVMWTIVEVLDELPYQITSKGVYKHISENAESVDIDELEFLQQKYRDKAQYYTQRLIRYMDNNSDLFPEYSSNEDEDINPSQNTYFHGWQL